MLVKPGQVLAGLKALLNGPAASGDPDQYTERNQIRRVAAVEREFAAVVVVVVVVVVTRTQQP